MTARRRALGAALLVAILGAAQPARAQPNADEAGEPPAAVAAAEEPVMRYPPSKVRFGLIGGGGAVFAIPYAVGAIAASQWPDVPGSKWLYAPVIGPWGALVKNDCTPPETECDAIFWVRNVLYVLDGITQLGGLALIGEGLFMTTEADAPPKASWTLLPTVSPMHTGLSLTGRF